MYIIKKQRLSVSPSLRLWLGKHSPVGITLRVYLLSLGVFTLLRLLLFTVYTVGKAAFSAEQAGWGNIFMAFVMGIRFDLMVTGYAMLLPFVLLSLAHQLGWQQVRRWFKIAIKWLIFATFTLAFTVGVVDIPFFNHFFSRFTAAAFAWVDSPLLVAQMVAQEPRFIIFLLPLAAVVAAFWLLLKRIFAASMEENASRRPLRRRLVGVLVCLLGLAAMAIGIRGKLGKTPPLRVGTAYFCNDPFLNQLGLNPVFTLFKSFTASPLGAPLMDSHEAIRNVQQYLSITPASPQHPLARAVSPTVGQGGRYNVVLVIMESMSASLMRRYGNSNNLTPFLDSIAQRGYSFDKTYTAGIHTFNGIFSTLSSFPALFRYQPLRDVHMLRHNGMAWALKKQGYSTIFFITHDPQFDNIEGFIRNNDFEEVISQKNYLAEEILSPFGVSDDYMFRFAVNNLNELHRKGKPFFATFMTCSNHTPYVVPDRFTPTANTPPLRAVEYSDWSLRQLVALAEKEPWGDSTIFVFVADHGGAYDPVYDMPINYHHTPFIIYAPKILGAPRAFDQLALQIDVFPTVMGVLNLPYVNNTLGVDVLAQPRPYAYFCADNKYGVLSDELFLVVKESGEEALYRYVDKDIRNVIGEHEAKAADMRRYALSNMQAYRYLLETKATMFYDR